MTPPADLPDAATPPRRRRAAANAALFLIVCTAGCALLQRVSPFPEMPGIYPKWAWFRQHRDEVDLLFVGSSRFFHQIIPPQFDAVVAAAGGAPVRSFNFGYDGMWPPESYYLLRRLLALRPVRLKWVVIDLMDVNSQLDSRNNSTLRMAYWHDTRHTRMAFDDILATPRSWQKKWALLAAHAQHWGKESLNLGRGADLLGRRLMPRPARKKPYAWEEHAGYDAEPARPMPATIQQEFADALEIVKAGLPPVPVRPVFREALRGIIADVRRAGAEPIFVIAPTVNARENFTAIPDGAAVWAFNDPHEHPVLFDPAHHFDAWHLNHAGAVEFTRLLAARFVGGREAAR